MEAFSVAFVNSKPLLLVAVLLEREFDKKTEAFRMDYMQKMIEKNHVKIMEMIKKSF